MKKIKNNSNILASEAGFLTAEFLFSFTLVIGSGIVIFAFTFALASVEIAQYITWSAARAYASGNVDAASARSDALLKYNNLTAGFPAITGNGVDTPWFGMTLDTIDDLSSKINEAEKENIDINSKQARHPWYGVRAKIDLKLFKNLQIPFLGKVTNDPSTFEINVSSVLLRNPSVDECKKFFDYDNKFAQGIKKMKVDSGSGSSTFEAVVTDPADAKREGYVMSEDNGC